MYTWFTKLVWDVPFRLICPEKHFLGRLTDGYRRGCFYSIRNRKRKHFFTKRRSKTSRFPHRCQYKLRLYIDRP
eukprot:UN15580